MTRSTICLNMIVKNEAHVILQTLENILQNIQLDYWVISDTGSTDMTKELIVQFFQERNIEGELVEHEWRDFGYNRTKAIESARGKADYLFIFDADDEIKGKLVLPEILIFDKYDFKFGDTFTYHRSLLINNEIRWCFKGVLHEYLKCEENRELTSRVLEGDYYLVSGKTGDRSKDPKKYYKDAMILKEAYDKERDRDIGLACRYAFYCAQSFKDAGHLHYDDSIEWYKRCLKDNWYQEKYYSCLAIGILYEWKQDVHNMYQYWLKAAEYDGERIEGVVYTMKKMQENNLHMMVHLLYKKYKNYEKSPKNKLFMDRKVYQEHIEYYNSISAFYCNELESGYRCSKHILINQKIDYYRLKMTLNNLIFYKSVMEKDEEVELLFERMNRLFQIIHKRGEALEESNYETWNILFDKVRRDLTKRGEAMKSLEVVSKAGSHTGSPTPTPQIILTFTTCKRLHLFQQTVHSLLNTWMDIDKIDYWFCVDDNSSEEDREEMVNQFGWIDFYMKTPEEKGHKKSMNIIWDKLNTMKPKYWIHIEDDFLFFEKMKYIEEGLKGFSIMKEDNVQQILFNVNYAETIDGYKIMSSKRKDADFAIHDHQLGNFNYCNCHYWPHYSFRPSIVCVDAILQLGNFDSDVIFFEKSYAEKWNEAGYKSGFLDKITNIHIGKLVKEKNNANNANAYYLNKENQF